MICENFQHFEIQFLKIFYNTRLFNFLKIFVTSDDDLKIIKIWQWIFWNFEWRLKIFNILKFNSEYFHNPRTVKIFMTIDMWKFSWPSVCENYQNFKVQLSENYKLPSTSENFHDPKIHQNLKISFLKIRITFDLRKLFKYNHWFLKNSHDFQPAVIIKILIFNFL